MPARTFHSLAGQRTFDKDDLALAMGDTSPLLVQRLDHKR